MTLITVEAKSIYRFRNGWSLDPWMAVQPDGAEAVLDFSIFKHDCWSQGTRAAWRIFLELSDITHSSPTLFLVTIESLCWAVTALGGYSLRLLPVAWYKHFMLKLGWTYPHTHSVIWFSQLYFYTLCLLSSHWKPLNVRHILFFFSPELVLSRSLACVEIKPALLASEFVLGKMGIIYNVSLNNI